MQLFRNILVGIDLARCNPLDGADLGQSVLEPVQWAVRLARLSSARLLFFSATDLGEDALAPLAEEDRTSVLDAITRAGSGVLEGLVRRAREEGVEARGQLVPGSGWLEIIRQVRRDGHDLVVVGTRDLTRLGHMLFGNTSVKLLRRCPCPVLVAKPPSFAGGVLGAAAPHDRRDDASTLNIMVATNLEPPSQEMLRLGIALAGQMNARLHVFHVVEYQLHEVCNIGLPDRKQQAYRDKVRDRAHDLLVAQMEQSDYKALGSRVEVHLAGDVGQPDVAIRHFIEAQRIHLLIMGTIARGGIRGIMIGNTAERLLHEVGCSVLALKPPDFVCPVDV